MRKYKTGDRVIVKVSHRSERQIGTITEIADYEGATWPYTVKLETGGSDTFAESKENLASEKIQDFIIDYADEVEATTDGEVNTPELEEETCTCVREDRRLINEWQFRDVAQTAYNNGFAAGEQFARAWGSLEEVQ